MARVVKVYQTLLVVEGSGVFPIDMLRHDTCFPRSEADTGYIEVNDGARMVSLVRRAFAGVPVNRARWASFGWRVVDESPMGEV